MHHIGRQAALTEHGRAVIGPGAGVQQDQSTPQNR